MIIRPWDERLCMIRQTDHAALAGQFAGAWGAAPFAPADPLEPVLLAARHHDDGWYAWEAAPRVRPDTGRPYDFLGLPPDQHLPIYSRATQLAVALHPYAGLLVSMHGVGLYKKRYGLMPHLRLSDIDSRYQTLVEQYLAEQEQVQQALLPRLLPYAEQRWMHYCWLQCWDLLSLYLCLKSPEEGASYSLGRMPHATAGAQGAQTELILRGASAASFAIRPWPFLAPELQVSIPMRLVANRHYSSDHDLLETLTAAPENALALRLHPDT